MLEALAQFRAGADTGIHELGLGIASMKRPGCKPGRVVKQNRAVFRCWDGSGLCSRPP